MHNADYIEVGDAAAVGPDNLIAIWAPEQRADQAHLTAALASYVKQTRNENGTDTVAFHIRYRVNPTFGIGKWSMRLYGPDQRLSPSNVLLIQSTIGCSFWELTAAINLYSGPITVLRGTDVQTLFCLKMSKWAGSKLVRICCYP